MTQKNSNTTERRKSNSGILEKEVKIVENNNETDNLPSTLTKRKKSIDKIIESNKSNINIENENDDNLQRPDFPHAPVARFAMLADNYHNGFMNLTGATLIVWALRHIVHSYKTSGILLDLELLKYLMADFPFMIFFWLLLVFIVWMVAIGLDTLKKITSYNKSLRPLVVILYSISQASLYILPPFVFHSRPMSPMLKLALCMDICVLSMKSHSYYMTNNYLYWKSGADERKGRQLSFKKRLFEFAEFLVMPTLVFEKQYPRTQKIRFLYVVKEWTVALCGFLVMYLIIQKNVLPILQENVTSKSLINDTFLQLCAPTILLWMIGFYCVFHCGLNGVSELTRFADREFYLDWWNATTMDAYWRLWNRAVYKFMCRHVYLESMRQVKFKFYNKEWAAIGTFIVTAVLHEYCLANAFGQLRPWLSLMIIGQIPFIYLTHHPSLKGTRYGNLLMWIALCFGMPQSLFLYCAEYYQNKMIKM